MVNVEKYWSSLEGKLHKARERALEAIYLDFQIDLRSKKSAKPQDRAIIQKHVEEDASPWVKSNGNRSGKWPHPRADLSLDIRVFTREKNSPRIDVICKWLLDELGSSDAGEVIYRDDRQVKWLFASKSVLETAPLEDPRTVQLLEEVKESLAPKNAHIYVIGQTLANRKADIKLAITLDPPWNSRNENNNPFVKPDFEQDFSEIDEILNYSTNKIFPGLKDELRHERKYQKQAALIESFDNIIPSIILQFGIDPDHFTGQTLRWLKQSPYVFDLGPMPTSSGGTTIFKKSTREKFALRSSQFSELFPPLTVVGVSLVYFETQQGKDLDNLIRIVLPILLDEIRPPLKDIPNLKLHSKETKKDSNNSCSKESGIQFVEAVSFSNGQGLAPPGTVLLILSSGWRRNSWWEEASEYLYEFPSGKY